MSIENAITKLKEAYSHLKMADGVMKDYCTIVESIVNTKAPGWFIFDEDECDNVNASRALSNDSPEGVEWGIRAMLAFIIGDLTYDIYKVSDAQEHIIPIPGMIESIEAIYKDCRHLYENLEEEAK